MADTDKEKLDKTEASGLFAAARFVKHLVKERARINIDMI